MVDSVILNEHEKTFTEKCTFTPLGETFNENDESRHFRSKVTFTEHCTFTPPNQLDHTGSRLQDFSPRGPSAGILA